MGYSIAIAGIRTTRRTMSVQPEMARRARRQQSSQKDHKNILYFSNFVYFSSMVERRWYLV